MKKPLKFKWKPRFPEHMPKWLRRTIVIVLCVAVGGGAVFGVLFLVRSGGGAVNVYKVQELSTSSGSVDQAETSGAVTPGPDPVRVREFHPEDHGDLCGGRGHRTCGRSPAGL